MNGAPKIRTARREDLGTLLTLIRAHAEYERAPAPRSDLVAALGTLLFATAEPDLTCFVVEDDNGTLLGYATCSPVTSTWQASKYMHLDCLYLQPAARGKRLGAALLNAVAELSRTVGLREVQWQTPVWNTGAIRFYDRTGATGSEKRRYTLALEES